MPDKRFEALQAACDGEIDEVLEQRPGLRDDAAIGGQQAVGAIAEDDAAKAVIGDNQVGAAADDDRGQPAGAHLGQGGDEGFGAAGFGVDIGRAADAESRVEGQRSACRNG